MAGASERECSHTLLLVQRNTEMRSRTYYDFERIHFALDALCELYENEEREKKEGVLCLTYDIADLHNFIDDFNDLSLLVCVLKALLSVCV
eukprot:6209114-Pleurochrysis_carterae.AAC.2